VSFRSRFLKEVASLGLPAGPGAADVVRDDELAALPEPARRFLRFMGVRGRPRDWSLRLGFEGRFRRGPDRPWLRCEAWQYSSGLAVARVMHLRIRAGGVVPVIGRDTYLEGRGRMRIKLLDLFQVGDGQGDEYDTGELVTYLNDAVLMAPSMLLVPEVRWKAGDGDSFDVTLTDRGRTVTAHVLVDEEGAPRDFSTTDRFMADLEDPTSLIRTPWSTPVAEWTYVDGHPLPSRARAIWHLPAGDFCYVDLELIPGSAAFNVAPGA
jgi:hypothetical protein